MALLAIPRRHRLYGGGKRLCLLFHIQYLHYPISWGGTGDGGSPGEYLSGDTHPLDYSLVGKGVWTVGSHLFGGCHDHGHYVAFHLANLWATICGGIALPWFCGRFLRAIPRHDVVYVEENSSGKGFCNSVAEAFL